MSAVECRAEADTAQRKTIISSFAHLGRRPKIGACRISIEAASLYTEFTCQRPDGLSFEELCQFKLLHIDLRRIVLGVQVHRRASVHIPLTLLQGKVCAIVGAGEIHRTEQTHGIRHVEGTRRTLRQQRAHAPGGACGRRVVQVPRALFAQRVAHKAVYLRFHQSRGVERNAFHRQIAQVARECKSHLDEVVFQQSLRHLVDLSAHRGRCVVARNGADVVRCDACIHTGTQRPAAVGLQRREVRLQRSADARLRRGEQHVGERHTKGVHQYRAAQLGNAQVALPFERRGVCQIQFQPFVFVKRKIVHIHRQSGNVKQRIVRQGAAGRVHAHRSFLQL